MDRSPRKRKPTRAQILADRAFASLERFVHVEAVSGVVLLLAAAIALIWANSPAAESYHHLWHAPISIRVGDFVFERTAHFWINDALMTVFFLVVGMEIRREIHEGALSDVSQASLPVIAAIGGVAVPAVIYLSFNSSAPQSYGWAVPTATDIAFAVGVLSLFGKFIPANVRVFLLALAIIDDIIAVLIIALFYTDSLDYSGLAVVGLGATLVLFLQWIGAGSAYAYIPAGAIFWYGLLTMGVHPTLTGVALGLMTPVRPRRMHEQPLDVISRIVSELLGEESKRNQDRVASSLKELRRTQREVLAPVVRVQHRLHPWVAFGMMPLFALANAGVTIQGVDLGPIEPQLVMAGVAVALFMGKPLGVFGVSYAMVRLGLCQLPPDVDWRGILLIGLLAGIGFTMSIFISMLAFTDENLLGAAKLGVLLGSVTAAVLGGIWGVVYSRGQKRRTEAPHQ